MDLKQMVDIASIVGSFSIFLTLIFIVIELKKNVEQINSVNIANRDLVNSEFTHFWVNEAAADLVIKGRNHLEHLNEKERFQFETFIEQRIKLFAFGSTTVFGKDREILDYRIQDFFRYSGSIKCYEEMKERSLVPPIWATVIDGALSK
tara:strand:+ start:877 stop:1323 length:447 start_codon:yes stop_codon:yes gene_type:complete